MTDHRSDGKRDIRTGPSPLLAWTLAWGVTGAALYISGVFNSPRTGPLWVALAGGAISWSIAGAFTFPAGTRDPSNRRNIAGFLVWALAYLVSFALVGLLTNVLPDSMGQLIIMLIGWSIGPGLGAFAGTRLLADRPSLGRSGLVAAAWILGFFAGGYVGLVGGYIGPELARILIGSLIGMPAALTLGFGSGCAIGGLVASAIAVTLTRLITRFLH